MPKRKQTRSSNSHHPQADKAMAIEVSPRKHRRRHRNRFSLLDALSHDMLLCAFAFLPAHSLLALQQASKALHLLAQHNCLWVPLLECLWQGKLTEPSIARALTQPHPMRRYRDSVQDSKRQRLEKEELCGQDWLFRFKKGAGEWWQEEDPFYTDGQASVINFHPDGTVSRWQGKGKDRRQMHAGFSIRWRFTKTQEGRRGQFVQLNRWPSLTIHRTALWGWRLESMWTCYTTDAQDERFISPQLDTDVSSNDESEYED